MNAQTQPTVKIIALKASRSEVEAMIESLGHQRALLSVVVRRKLSFLFRNIKGNPIYLRRDIFSSENLGSVGDGFPIVSRTLNEVRNPKEKEIMQPFLTDVRRVNSHTRKPKKVVAVAVKTTPKPRNTPDPKSQSEKIKAGFARRAQELGVSSEQYQEQVSKGKSPVAKESLYTSVQMSMATGRSRQYVRKFLRGKYPDREFEGKVYFKQAEYDECVKELSDTTATRRGPKGKPKEFVRRPVEVAPEPQPKPVVIERDVVEIPLKIVEPDSPIALLQARLLPPVRRHHDE